ncbi:hypothetical protein GIB67_027155 [Kingdonia uniflora]|uniref:FACT complex subunit SSRP1 n=1 Tax=Kingdonia uniflora TaxID=39325 RepID=A0A7J7P2A3_9MAGN|nr:hypothetical protein GIB67_027155 [Kingdonia uniflora]
MTDGHLFNNILLSDRTGSNPGQMRIHSGGIVWKKQGGGKLVEVEKDEIAGVTWIKVPRAYQLVIKVKNGLKHKFTGFRDQDVSSLTAYIQKNVGITPEDKQLSISGHNWGEVDLNGNTLTFLVEQKQAFEISLADVQQTQLQGKNDVSLEFHVNDSSGANEKDSLMEISFHVPNSNTQFIGDEEHPAALVFREKIMSMADVNVSADGAVAVAVFDGIAILTPRGRYTVELHSTFLRLMAAANDFKIQYSSVVRLFLLPKSNQQHTFVVVTLDPPIRKGQTLYPHIVLQFETDYVIESTLTLSEDTLASKYKDKLEASYKGLIHEVFTMILRGLSGAKVTRPGKFRSCQDGYAVKSSLKAEDGLLYPLEKGFFFLPKPPTLITHDEIDYVDFERHSAAGANMSYFDLLIKLKSEQAHLFRSIQRNEYNNLREFISGKGLKIMDIGDAGTTDGVAAVLQNDDDDAVDPHLERIRNAAGGDESDEEDEDFVAGKDDSGSPTDSSGGEDSDASENKDDKEKPTKKEAKKEAPTASKPSSSAKRKTKDGEEEGSKKRKVKKKKDPNAPKKALSAFMFFSQSERENVKKSNPGITFTDVGRVLGERWRQLTAEEKEPYEAKARSDTVRYKEAVAGYKGTPVAAMEIDSGNESDSN